MGSFNEWVEGQGLSAERLVPRTSALESKALGGDFALPVFVIQGAEDFTTPTSLARGLVNSIRAPRKEFVSIEGGGHFAVFMKSGVFLSELVARVLPLAKDHGTDRRASARGETRSLNGSAQPFSHLRVMANDRCINLDGTGHAAPSSYPAGLLRGGQHRIRKVC